MLRQDEFYTQMPDIQAEINAYLDYDADTFRGKTVLLPCDDPEWSNFTLFFAQNFERLGLKKLISTSYAPESKTAKYGVLFEYAALQNGETPKNERETLLRLQGDGSRPCECMVEGRRHQRGELPDALQDAQPRQRQRIDHSSCYNLFVQ